MIDRDRARMKSDWEARAGANAEQSVYTRDLETDEADLNASGRVNFEQLVRPFLPVLLRGRAAKSCRVAEIGCGIGRMTQWLATEFLEVDAVDISAGMIERARERLKSHPNVRLHVNSGTDLDCLPGGSFDLVFSYLVFQHIPSRQVTENYLREAARVLRPEGGILFQLNGDWLEDDPARKPDTWLGEIFSLTEAIAILARAGLQPITATGAGTQYLLLAARKPAAGSEPLTSFLLPGASSPATQLLEGWDPPAVDGYRPIDPLCRSLLAMPEGSRQRLFLVAYFPPREPFPGAAFTVKVNNELLESVRVEQAGDSSFEWDIPAEACAAERAEVTLEFDTGAGRCLPWIRSMGIYPAVRGPSPAGRRQWEGQERIAWIRELEAQLAIAESKLRRDHGDPGRRRSHRPEAP